MSLNFIIHTYSFKTNSETNYTYREIISLVFAYADINMHVNCYIR
jgi:hypothetical protein